MKILFVCKHNRFRSKVAESIFNFVTKKKGFNVKSAGVAVDFSRPYIAKEVIDVLEQKGLKVSDENSRAVDVFLMDWADKIIIVADNVSKEPFPKEKTIIWPVRDKEEGDIDGIKLIVDEIEHRILKFLDDLE